MWGVQESGQDTGGVSHTQGKGSCPRGVVDVGVCVIYATSIVMARQEGTRRGSVSISVEIGGNAVRCEGRGDAAVSRDTLDMQSTAMPARARSVRAKRVWREWNGCAQDCAVDRRWCVEWGGAR